MTQQRQCQGCVEGEIGDTFNGALGQWGGKGRFCLQEEDGLGARTELHCLEPGMEAEISTSGRSGVATARELGVRGSGGG